MRRLVLLLCLAFLAGIPAGAHAVNLGLPGWKVGFSEPEYTVRASDGQAVVTVVRTNTDDIANVRYGIKNLPVADFAIPWLDFDVVRGRLDFAKGQSTATFTVPLHDHGIVGPDRTAQLYLFGPWHMSFGPLKTATLRIGMNGALDPVRDARNPLALRATPPPGYPLRGARFFVDHDHRYGWWPYLHRHPSLRLLAEQPTMKRFGKWDGEFSGARVSRYLSRAFLDDPDGIPAIGTMRLNHRTVCSHWADTPGDEAFFARWIRDFARGVGNFRTIVFLEQDALITVPCLNREGIARRLREVSDAIDVLSKLPHAIVYVDAGAGDALPAAYAARLLERVGVGRIQGFFLNSDHFDWTSREIAYGQQIARLTGAHFIVSTHANGRGPLYRRDPRHEGVEDICNPRGRGIGPLPTSHPGFRWLDAFYWVGNPARSGGACGHGDPKVGDFAPGWAEELVRLADHRVR